MGRARKAQVRSATTGVKDVARRAGVSVGTVSNVLNVPRRSASRRRKVLRAIHDLGFIRNESGRQLRAARSRTIAYLVLDASNPFFTDVAKGVEEVARDTGMAVYLCNSDSDPSRQGDYLALLAEQRVRGILITPVDQDTSELQALAQRRGIPVVLVGPRCWQRLVGSVGVDDVEGGTLAVTHLIEQGHQRITFIGGPMSTVQVADRLLGARAAVESAGRSPDDLAVLTTDGLNVAEGQRAGERLLGLPRARRPTAAFLPTICSLSASFSR